MNCQFNGSTTITLKATDDGKPNPPGALSYTILSKPAHGRLELTSGTAIDKVPAKLTGDKVVYRPTANWLGQDSFTFFANDGGSAPFGGQSNTATMRITIVKQMTVEYQVKSGVDDTFGSKSGTDTFLKNPRLGVGMHVAGMRFASVTIPQGSTILHASLKICAHPDGLTAWTDGFLKGEAADNPPEFGTASHFIGPAPTTTASTPWKWTDANPWEANAWYESPEISAVLQEIVDRPGWASDNALVIVYTFGQDSFGDERRFWSYDGDPTKAAKLTITFQPK